MIYTSLFKTGGVLGWLRESLVPTLRSTLRNADAPTYHATGRVNAANAYAITWEEGSFQDACFHQKSKKPTTGPSKNSHPSMGAEFLETRN